MILDKLKALHAHLENAELVASEHLASWMEDGKIMTARKNEGTGIVICRLKYDAVYVLEIFTGDPAELIAHFSTWLMDFDTERDRFKLPEPSIDIDMLDDDTALIEFRVTFQENIEVEEDAEGKITFQDKQYKVTNLTEAYADTVGVGNDGIENTDLPFTRDE